MEPFKTHNGTVVPLDMVSIDTDQIIPKQFLKRVERTGFGQFLFYGWRFLADGSPNPKFILNGPQYKGASVMVTGANFGCGSSREHAPWALEDYGIKAVIAPSFADIFRNNCFQIGLLPVVLPEEHVRTIMARAEEIPGYKVTVDLENKKVTDSQDLDVSFDVDEFRRYCLLNGLDDIGLTLQSEADITTYEAKVGASS
ncbi:MAG: 3-isopropylmalate dehydratase small subunit [Chloroflexi bacterium]|nr:3-isopropylmalate dehydratase small subunit [Chloroflexota bacterium]